MKKGLHNKKLIHSMKILGYKTVPVNELLNNFIKQNTERH